MGDMSDAIYIVGNQGLGDHLVCNGIYREYAKLYTFCVIGVTKRYEFTLKKMLEDLSNVRIVAYPVKYWNAYSLAHARILQRKIGFDVLMIGHLGLDFLTDPHLRLDACFYHQANIELDLRWSNFRYKRDFDKELHLFNLFGCISAEYVFLHEDESRNFRIRRESLPSNIRVIEPDIDLEGFTIFDYRMIIENAKEIHCIESSFSAFIEMLPINVPKFAHRYSRPEAKNDYCHEFTYKSAWDIVL